MPIRPETREQDPVELAKKLIKQIGAYGDDAIDEVKDIHRRHDPASIFRMSDGPEKSKSIGGYISELRETLRTLIRERQIESLKESKKKAKVASELEEAEAKIERRKKARDRAKRKRDVDLDSGRSDKVEVTYPGNYQGFRYEVHLLRNGMYLPQVTHQARKLMPFVDDQYGKAPEVKSSRFLAKLYKTKDDAEIAARRAINETLLWYDERGLQPIERKRRTAGVKGSIRRRTAPQVQAHRDELSEAERLAQRKRIVQEREVRKGKAKLERAARERYREASGETRGPEDRVKALASGRTMYIPKKNPSSFKFFGNGEGTTAREQTDISLSKYKGALSKFKKSVNRGSAKYEYLMEAYDAIENARANAHLAGKAGLASKLTDVKENLSEKIKDTLEYCTTMLSDEGVFIENPTPPEHAKIGEGYLDKAEKAWDAYSKSGKGATLLDAYKKSELACEEISYASSKTGLSKAKKIRSMARSEIKRKMGN